MARPLAKPITFEDKIECLRREIDMRVRVYSRKVLDGSMARGTADREIEIMKAILDDYEGGYVR